MAGCRVQAAAVPGRTGSLGDGSHGAGPPFGFDCTYVQKGQNRAVQHILHRRWNYALNQLLHCIVSVKTNRERIHLPGVRKCTALVNEANYDVILSGPCLDLVEMNEQSKSLRPK